MRNIFLCSLLFFTSVYAEILTYGNISTSKPKTDINLALTHIDLIRLLAKYNIDMQQIHIRYLNAVNHMQTEKNQLSPIYKANISLQKDENIDSDTPNINLTSNWHNSYGGNLSIGIINGKDFNGTERWLPSVSYQQPLMRHFGKTVNTAGLKNAENQVKIINIEAEKTLSDLVVKLEELLMRYNITEKKISYTNKMLTFNKKQIFLRRKKIEAGEIATSTLLTAELNHQKMKLRILDAKKDRSNIINQISNLVGVDLYHAKIDSKPISLPANISSWSFEKIQALAKKHAYDVKVQKINHENFNLDLEVAKNANDIDLNLYLKTESWQKRTQIGLNVDFPINNPSSNESIQRIKNQQRQSLLSQSTFMHNLNNRIQRFQDAVKMSEQTLEFSEQSRDNAKKIYDIYEKKFSAQLVSSLELEHAFLDWYDSGLTYIEKTQQLSKSKLDLLNTIGYLLPELEIELKPYAESIH